MSTQYVYRFGGGATEGSKEMKALLGGKGANLAEMSAIGLPVPPGFNDNYRSLSLLTVTITPGPRGWMPRYKKPYTTSRMH